jgi:hypothetical protein
MDFSVKCLICCDLIFQHSLLLVLHVCKQFCKLVIVYDDFYELPLKVAAFCQNFDKNTL